METRLFSFDNELEHGEVVGIRMRRVNVFKLVLHQDPHWDLQHVLQEYSREKGSPQTLAHSP